MNKQELVRKIAFDAELSQRQANNVLESLLNTIMETVAAGDRVQLMGFGVFETKHRAARTGRNINTNEAMEIPETTIPVFKPGVEFKEIVSKNA